MTVAPWRRGSHRPYDENGPHQKLSLVGIAEGVRTLNTPLNESVNAPSDVVLIAWLAKAIEIGIGQQIASDPAGSSGCCVGAGPSASS
jgi:hypothetical protein